MSPIESTVTPENSEPYGEDEEWEQMDLYGDDGSKASREQRFKIKTFLKTIKVGNEDAKVFKIISEKDRTEGILELHQFWGKDMILRKDDLINIVDVDSELVKGVPTFRVQRNSGFLIKNPDKLISITSIMNRLWCKRKAAFSEIFSFPLNAEAILRGNIAHELTGRAMKSESPDLDQMLESILSSTGVLQSAYGQRMKEMELQGLGKNLIPHIRRFIETRFKKANDPVVGQTRISKLIDIEDNYWNPTFGIKGKIDATVELRNHQTTFVGPLEFKTGNPGKKSCVKNEHQGQAILYTLLMRPRYGNLNLGILYYITEDSFYELKANILELQLLILMRNMLVDESFLLNGDFPYFPQIEDFDYKMKCKGCEYQNICSLFHRRVEGNESEMGNFISSRTNHLTEKEIQFFNHHFQFISFETAEYFKSADLSRLWRLPSSEREKKGQCISNLRVLSRRSENSQYLVTFIKSGDEIIFHNISLSERDMVAIGTETEVCFATAFINSITKTSLTLCFYEDVSVLKTEGKLFTVDKVSVASPLRNQYWALTTLMEDSPKAKRIRDILVNYAQPNFTSLKTKGVDEKNLLTKLNGCQRKAVLKAYSTDSFLFVKGMPGTGKTETIVSLIKFLVSKGLSVLVLAYTGQAVDNVLLKLKRNYKNFLRIGENSKLAEELKPFSSSTLFSSGLKLDQLTEELNAKQVVGTTLMSLKHELFSIRRFDYCIVDETSQAIPISLFGGLQLAEKFVFFGDPSQLPAIINSQEMAESDYVDSFFLMLSRPENTVTLNVQYRMNVEIMNLANLLVYEGAMTCGSKAQETQTISCKDVEGPVWLRRKVLSSAVEYSVLFLDTALVDAFESKIGDSYRNEGETDLTLRVLKGLVRGGIEGSNIGVIAPYRGQVLEVRRAVRRFGEVFSAVEVSTVDQYQGRDKDVIICSLTRSKQQLSEEDFDTEKAGIMNDIRRLNVAITRAKKKLIFIGNRNTLIRYEPLKNLVDILKSKQVHIIKDLEPPKAFGTEQNKKQELIDFPLPLFN